MILGIQTDLTLLKQVEKHCCQSSLLFKVFSVVIAKMQQWQEV